MGVLTSSGTPSYSSRYGADERLIYATTLLADCARFSKSEKRSSSTLTLNKSGEGYKKSMFRTLSDGLLKTPLQQHHRSLLLQSKIILVFDIWFELFLSVRVTLLGLGASTNSYFRHLLSYLADFFDLSTDTSRMSAGSSIQGLLRTHLNIEPLQERLNILELEIILITQIQHFLTFIVRLD